MATMQRNYGMNTARIVAFNFSLDVQFSIRVLTPLMLTESDAEVVWVSVMRKAHPQFRPTIRSVATAVTLYGVAKNLSIRDQARSPA